MFYLKSEVGSLIPVEKNCIANTSFVLQEKQAFILQVEFNTKVFNR